ncbi:MAG: AmmeMemoRadiSam system protein A [Sandaracinaceae bacterium]
MTSRPTATHPRNPYLTVDVVTETAGGLVLIERASPPSGWALPGGFVDYGEDPADAARREVAEETGLQVSLHALLGVYGEPDRDPRQHNVSVVYVGRAEGTPLGGDDARRAEVFALDALPSPLAFDHAAILEDYRRYRREGRLPVPPPARLADGDLSVLLVAARDALEAAVRGRAPRLGLDEQRPAVRTRGAAFVTLRTTDGTLRGCIGEVVAHRPLVDAVRDMAVGAAFRDPRFPPVDAGELAGLRIGLSVLSAPEPLTRSTDLEVGRHGVLVERGGNRGVLLPEVGAERGWTADELLAATCRKGGLPEDAYRDDDVTVAVFETTHAEEAAAEL